MGKLKQKPPIHQKKPVESAPPEENYGKNLLSQLFGLKSILWGVVGLLVLYSVVNNSPGYSWVWNTMLSKNWKIIRKYPDATFDQRYEMKLGFLYSYYNFVKNNTPEDAIILFPESSKIFEGRQDVDQRITDKMCLTYFLYPRTIIVKNEVNNPLFGKETHVAIASGNGYEDLGYEMGDKPDFAVYPKQHHQ